MAILPKVILPALVLLGACAAQQKECTLIGCADGLSINFKGQMPAAFNLKLKASGESDLNIDCPGGTSRFICLPESVFINQYTPEQVELTYTAGDKTVTQSFKPTYTQAQPNGPSCGPNCRQGHIEVTL